MHQLDWNAALDQLRESVPQAQFQNWLKPLRLISSDEKTITIGVPSRFHEDWVRTKYSPILKQAIRKQTGHELQLEFEILLKEANEDAALSNEPELLIPDFTNSTARITATQKPTLRVIDGSKQETQPTQQYAPSFIPQFESPFLCLSYNQTAYQFAQLFCDNHAQVNPLVIYAGVGMGKTHLLSQIAKWLKEKKPNLRIRYTNSESFTSELFATFKSLEDSFHFKKKYRDETDVLLFDDVHTLATRPKVQEGLLHLYNELLSKGGKVVFTSSILPQKIDSFVDPLKSRLVSAMTAEIKMFNFEEKVELLRKIVEQNKIIVEETVLRTLASQGQKDARDIIGSLLRAHLHASISNNCLDSNYLKREGWVSETPRQSITLEEIISIVEHNFAITRTDLFSKSRKGNTNWARQVAMYLARKYTLLSLELIGKKFGRDHSTVLYAHEKVRELMYTHPSKKYEVEFIIKKIESHIPKGQNPKTYFQDQTKNLPENPDGIL